MRGKDARVRFVDSYLSKGIAFQVQGLRGREEWTQEKLAAELGSTQMGIYRLENPNYGRQTLTTLKKVADVFDVGLVVRFVPFSQLVDWASGTPHVDPGLVPSTLEVPSFQTEVERGVFEETSVQKCTEDKEVDAALAKKISGEDKIQDRADYVPNPVIEGASTTQGQHLRVPLIILVANPNVGGFPDYGNFGRHTG
jgi:transcriptional regulator with XRE-family HTH domain